MNRDDFLASVTNNLPPSELPAPLLALWHDARGSWEKAHDSVQNEEGAAAALVHAYLHRKEGDGWNARYWYTRAGRKPFVGSLEEEWQAITSELLVSRKAAA
jgi:hypothetical protein